uniref:Uncharacterized protein n=1 Tax=Rhizophagus irregularis (strain DAOM 181602 / DAOM 197198 / MUCL 43194) TaxID=747089 RepID=U9UZN5_RHIID
MDEGDEYGKRTGTPTLSFSNEYDPFRQNLNYDGLRRFRISFILFGLIFTTEAFGIIANNCDQAVKVAAFVGIYISFGYLPLRKNESVITEQDRSTKYCGTKIQTNEDIIFLQKCRGRIYER